VVRCETSVLWLRAVVDESSLTAASQLALPFEPVAGRHAAFVNARDAVDLLPMFGRPLDLFAAQARVEHEVVDAMLPRRVAFLEGSSQAQSFGYAQR